MEKAGIIKPGVPVLVGERCPVDLLKVCEWCSGQGGQLSNESGCPPLLRMTLMALMALMVLRNIFAA